MPKFYLGSNLNHNINLGLPSDAINHLSESEYSLSSENRDKSPETVLKVATLRKFSFQKNDICVTLIVVKHIGQLPENIFRAFKEFIFLWNIKIVKMRF